MSEVLVLALLAAFYLMSGNASKTEEEIVHQEEAAVHGPQKFERENSRDEVLEEPEESVEQEIRAQDAQISMPNKVPEKKIAQVDMDLPELDNPEEDAKDIVEEKEVVGHQRHVEMDVSVPMPSNQQKSIVPNWASISVLLGSLLINILLAFMVLYSFRRKDLVVNSRNPSMSEDSYNTLVSSLEKLNLAVGNLQASSSGNNQKLDELNEIFDTLHKALNEKDEEIKRLKKGYDAHIYKQFVRKFVLISSSLSEILGKKDSQNSDYEAIQFRLEDALEDCGVEERNVDIGADYRDLGDLVEDHPKLIPTEDADKFFRIAELIRPAYVLTSNGEEQVIIPAKVSIFSQHKGD